MKIIATPPTNPDIKREIRVNTATDPGVQFEIFNACIGFMKSMASGFISLGVAGLCGYVAYLSQCRKLGASNHFSRAVEKAEQHPEQIQSKVITTADRFVKNTGAPMIVSGAALGISAGFAALAGVDRSSLAQAYETGKPALILLSFGIANASRGISKQFEETSAARGTLNFIGTWSAVAGLTMSGLGTDFSKVIALDWKELFGVLPKAALVGAGIIETLQASGYLKKLKLSPNLALAGGTGTNAISNLVQGGEWQLTVANLGFTSAFFALDSLLAHNGLYKRVRGWVKTSGPEPV